jgi:hypothetical protein
MRAFPMDDAAANEKGTWQMWSASPLGQEGLGFVGGPGSWLLSSQMNVPKKDDFVLPSSQMTMPSVFNKDDNLISSIHPPQNVFLHNGQSGGTFSPVMGSSNYEPWLQTAFYPPLSGGLKTKESATQNEMMYGISSGSASSPVLESSPAKSWSK